MDSYGYEESWINNVFKKSLTDKRNITYITLDINTILYGEIKNESSCFYVGL